MIFDEGGSRVDDLRLIAGKVAAMATKFDSDGISLRVMNGSAAADGIRSEVEAGKVVDGLKFRGITPLGTELHKKVLQPLVLDKLRSGTLTKPVLIIVITDGEPMGEDRSATATKVKAALDACRAAGRPGAFTIEFAHIGSDARAATFLHELDDDPVIGPWIDATSNYEMESVEWAKSGGGGDLEPGLWLMKLMCGAINPDWDQKD